MALESETEIHVHLTQHDEQIKTLFNRQEKLETLTESVNNLALSVKELTHDLKDTQKIVAEIQENNKYKSKTIWTTIVTGVISAVIGYVMGILLR